jgi:hypothetical protein
MQNKMTIQIVDVSTDDPNVKQTVSKFVVEENDKVTFQNKGSSDAKVDFGASAPLCQGNTPLNPIQLPLNGTKTLKVCVASGEYKYTATVTGALAEDPILIVEKALVTPPSQGPRDLPRPEPIVFPEGYVYLLLTAAAAFFIGLWFGKRRPLPGK